MNQTSSIISEMDPGIDFKSCIENGMHESDLRDLDDYIETMRLGWDGQQKGMQDLKNIAIMVKGITQIAKGMKYTFKKPSHLAMWIHINSDDFWIPENNDDVWSHLKYIYTEYTKFRVEAEMHEKLNYITTQRQNLNLIYFVSKSIWQERRSPLISINDNT